MTGAAEAEAAPYESLGAGAVATAAGSSDIAIVPMPGAGLGDQGEVDGRPDASDGGAATAPPGMGEMAAGGDQASGGQAPRSSRRFLRPAARDGGPPVPLDIDAPARFLPQTRTPISATGSGEWRGKRVRRPFPAVGPRFRIGLIPPAAIGFVTLIAVAIVIFLLPGFLAGGGPGPAATVTPTPRAAVATHVGPTRPPRPERTPFSYTVRPGDTLRQLGRRFGVAWQKIACASHIRNPNLLSIGQELTIPPPGYQCPGAVRRTPTPKPTLNATPAPPG
jgi:nucleoid-associated protein YgaU